MATAKNTERSQSIFQFGIFLLTHQRKFRGFTGVGIHRTGQATELAGAPAEPVLQLSCTWLVF